MTLVPSTGQTGSTAVYLYVTNPSGGQASTTFHLVIAPATPTPVPTATPRALSVLPLGAPTVIPVPATPLPPGLPPADQATGGVVMRVPTGPSGAYGVVETGAGAPFRAAVAVPAPASDDGVVVRLQPAPHPLGAQLPPPAVLPAGVEVVALLRLDVVDPVTGTPIAPLAPPVRLGVELTTAAQSICTADPARVALIRITADGRLVRLPIEALDCSTGVLIAPLGEGGTIAVVTMPTGLTIPFLSHLLAVHQRGSFGPS